MQLKKAYMYDAYHNKIRHTYINPDDPDAISWIISTKKYQTLLNIKIKGSLYLLIGDKKSTNLNGILVEYDGHYYSLHGNILFLCVSDDLMSVKNAEVELKDISNKIKIIKDHD